MRFLPCDTFASEWAEGNYQIWEYDGTGKERKIITAAQNWDRRGWIRQENAQSDGLIDSLNLNWLWQKHRWQTTSCGWQIVLKLEGISTHNQPCPTHDKEQASDYTHHLVGTMTIDWFKYVTKLLSIEMRHKIVGTDWIVAVNSKFRKARYALCFQINLDIRGNLSKMGKTFSENKIHRSNLAFWGLFCQSLGERWFHKKTRPCNLLCLILFSTFCLLWRSVACLAVTRFLNLIPDF